MAGPAAASSKSSGGVHTSMHMLSGIQQTGLPSSANRLVVPFLCSCLPVHNNVCGLIERGGEDELYYNLLLEEHRLVSVIKLTCQRVFVLSADVCGVQGW
jgi:hypothetical protein